MSKFSLKPYQKVGDCILKHLKSGARSPFHCLFCFMFSHFMTSQLWTSDFLVWMSGSQTSLIHLKSASKSLAKPLLTLSKFTFLTLLLKWVDFSLDDIPLFFHSGSLHLVSHEFSLILVSSFQSSCQNLCHSLLVHLPVDFNPMCQFLYWELCQTYHPHCCPYLSLYPIQSWKTVKV